MTTKSLVMEDIREKYPNPVKCSSDAGVGNYCVGGALIKMACDVGYGLEIAPLPSRIGFPFSGILAHALRVVNPALSIVESYEAADKITWANDAEDFESAWGYLRVALESHPSAVATGT